MGKEPLESGEANQGGFGWIGTVLCETFQSCSFAHKVYMYCTVNLFAVTNSKPKG